MAREFATRFYKSKYWKRTRSAYFNYKHGLCERCSGVGKIVHHKIYLTPFNINDTSISLDWNNLELLCESCHIKEHRNTIEYYFDDEGNIFKKK